MKKMKCNYLSIFNKINPFQSAVPNSERLTRLLTFVFVIFAFYLIYKEFYGVVFLFSKGITFWGCETAIYYLPFILLLLATFLFWIRLNVGWVMMCIYITYSIIRNFGFLLIYWNIDPFGTILIDSIFPRITPIYQILTILIYGTALWIVARNETLKKFNISRNFFLITIIITTILTFFNNFPSHARAFIFWFVGGE